MSSLKTDHLVVLDEFREDSVEPLPSEERQKSGGVQWTNWGPSVAGDVTPCFKGGFLFRIYNPQTKIWALYNDTYVYEMHASFTFTGDAKLEPFEGVELKREDGQQRLSVVVYPMETVLLMRADRYRFRSLFDGKPLSEAYLKRKSEESQESVRKATEALAQITTSTNDEEVLAACKQHKVLFVDPTFPPCQESIDVTGKMSVSGWQRPTEYLPKHFLTHIRLFRQPVTPSSTQRGELGDSWFISGIAAISEDDKYIKDLFRHPSEVAAETLAEEECGAHRVLMNINGYWRSIIVDSYLPILGNQPRFARSAKDPCEMWVSMMEKAYAKRNKAYSNIVSGDPLLAIRDFTGFPTCRLDAKFQESIADSAQSNAFFDRLLACFENGHVILFSTPGNSDARSKSPRYNENGVFVGYAYGVLQVARIGDQRLLQLRNPWASVSQWKGRWAPHSEMWTRYPEACQYFPQYNGKDQSFVLDWEEVSLFFVGCGIMFNHYHYIDYRIPFSFQGGVAGICLEVAVTEPTALTIILSQEDRRGSKMREEYVPIMLSLARQSTHSKSEYTLIVNSAADLEVLGQGFTFLQGRDIYLMYTFLPEYSPYLVVPRRLVQPGDPDEFQCVLGVLSQLPFTPYGQVQVRFKKLSDENNVFNNFASFTNDAEDVTATFQIKKNAATVTETTSSKLN